VILTLEQERVILDSTPRKKVLAAAGSGKTFLLVEQLRKWAQDGASPGTTAAISFTRRASRQLHDRIEAVLGYRLGYVGTIHSFAHASLWRYGKRLSVVDDNDLAQIAAMRAEEAKLGRNVSLYKTMKIMTSSKPQKVRGPELALAKLVANYLTLNRLYHIDHVLPAFLMLMRRDPNFKTYIQGRLKTLMWDEYQDSNKVESEILAELDPDRSFIIGDVRQAIYQFRGSVAAHLERLPSSFHQLNINFRSGSRIVEAANSVMQMHSPLRPFRSDPGQLALMYTPNQDGDAAALVHLVRDRNEKPLHVLCRTNMEIADLVYGLEEAGLKVETASANFDRFNLAPWRPLVHACRFIMDPSCDWVAWTLWKALDPRPGKTVLEGGLWPNLVSTSQAPEVMQRLAELKADEATGFEVLEIIDDAIPGFDRKLSAMVRPQDEHLLAEPVVDLVAWWYDRDVQDLLPGEGQDPDVVLMTVHASKGLEFDKVALVNCGRPRKITDINDDERNILYVGVTRAKHSLFLIGDEGWLKSRFRASRTGEEA